ncbi:ribonuclease H2, subunit B [Mucidula mucida]|nr:ribonuclease H2, subunit B [Mucidula mucida]
MFYKPLALRSRVTNGVSFDSLILVRVLEVQAVSPSNKRSWFVDQSVVADGKLLMMTPIDPAFLLIPLLELIAPNAGATSFRTSEDIFEECVTRIKEKDDAGEIAESDLSRLFAMGCIEAALHRICETKDVASTITVFRYSHLKILTYLQAKVNHLSAAPMADISRSITRNFAKDGLFEDDKEDLLKAARLRVACDLVSHYLSGEWSDKLAACYDFKALDVHLTDLHNQETQLAVSRNTKAAAAPEKKRKAGKGSQGVEKLKKVNTKGMSKLSTFFTKK